MVIFLGDSHSNKFKISPHNRSTISLHPLDLKISQMNVTGGVMMPVLAFNRIQYSSVCSYVIIIVAVSSKGNMNS